MSSLKAGETVTMTAERKSDFGWFLSDGTEEVLLHENEITEEPVEGQNIDVFLYHDQKGRLTAAMKIPEISLDRYAWVEVVDAKPGLGAFVHIGISKDVLVSEDDLPAFESVWPTEGDRLYCILGYDQRGRLIAKPATEPVMEEDLLKEAPETMFNKNVSGTVYRLIIEGSHMITQEGYKGFIHKSERLREPRLGEQVDGRVIGVKDDGTINVSLLPRKQEALDEDAQKIYDYMESRGGAMPYWDKSYPEDIKIRFQMSKAAFKRAIGKLMKEGKVYQEGGWTYFGSKKKEQEEEQK